MNRVCQILNIRYPVIQAPMNWITNAEMIAAVSQAGGLGILGPNAGKAATGLSSLPQLEYELGKTRQLTDKPLGINILPFAPDNAAAMDYARKQIDIAIRHDVNIFAVVGEPNPQLFAAIKQAGGIIVFRQLTPTVAGAKQAEQWGADVLVATGIDEGGWIPDNGIGTFSIVPMLADTVSIPVVAAGGINDIRAVRAAFALGAQGVYIGTRFIATDECPANAATKQAILAGKGADLIHVARIVRSLPTPFAKRLAQDYQHGVDDAALLPQTDLCKAMLEGQHDAGIISVNTAIDNIHHIISCQQLIAELMADFHPSV